MRTETESTLKWFDNEITQEDELMNIWQQSWLLKLKVGGLFLNMRGSTTLQKLCPICGMDEETVVHFLVGCFSNTHKPTSRVLAITDNCPVQWMLSIKRTVQDRLWINQYNHDRWMAREPWVQRAHTSKGKNQTLKTQKVQNCNIGNSLHFK